MRHGEPWLSGKIRLPPCGLREVCLRVAVMLPGDLAKVAAQCKRPSLMYEAISWRRDQPAHWLELLRLFEIRLTQPVVTGRTQWKHEAAMKRTA